LPGTHNHYDQEANDSSSLRNSLFAQTSSALDDESSTSCHRTNRWQGTTRNLALKALPSVFKESEVVFRGKYFGICAGYRY